MGSLPSPIHPWWTQIWSGQEASLMQMRPGSTCTVLSAPFSPSMTKE